MAFDRQAAIRQLELVHASLENLKDSCKCEREFFPCIMGEDEDQCPACDLAWAVETELFEIDEILNAVKREELIYS